MNGRAAILQNNADGGFLFAERSKMSLLKILKEEKDARMLFIIFSFLMLFGMGCLLFAIFQGHIIGGL